MWDHAVRFVTTARTDELVMLLISLCDIFISKLLAFIDELPKGTSSESY